MMHPLRLRALILSLLAGAVPLLAQSPQPATGTLDVYMPDVEGGGAKLFVTPSGA